MFWNKHTVYHVFFWLGCIVSLLPDNRSFSLCLFFLLKSLARNLPEINYVGSMFNTVITTCICWVDIMMFLKDFYVYWSTFCSHNIVQSKTVDAIRCVMRNKRNSFSGCPSAPELVRSCFSILIKTIGVHFRSCLWILYMNNIIPKVSSEHQSEKYVLPMLDLSTEYWTV